jgi:hypothetical protein
MTKNALWIAILVVALADAGCSELNWQNRPRPSSAAPATTAQICQSAGDCNLTVTIDTSQAPCKAVVNPEVTVVQRVHDVRIVWTLDAPDDYKFVYLRFKDEEAPYRVQNAGRITIPSRDQFYGKKTGARQVQVHDKNTKDGAWYYELRVSNGTTTCEVDPPMING